jgi:hypothetical protein
MDFRLGHARLSALPRGGLGIHFHAPAHENEWWS